MGVDAACPGLVNRIREQRQGPAPDYVPFGQMYEIVLCDTFTYKQLELL